MDFLDTTVARKMNHSQWKGWMVTEKLLLSTIIRRYFSLVSELVGRSLLKLLDTLNLKKMFRISIPSGIFHYSIFFIYTYDAILYSYLSLSLGILLQYPPLLSALL